MKDTPNGHIERELAPTLTRFLVVFMTSFGSSRRPLPLRNLGIGCLTEEVLLHNVISKNMIEASALVSVSYNLDFPVMKHLSSVVHISRIRHWSPHGS